MTQENLVLAISMTAAEFLDEEVSEWNEIVPGVIERGKYVCNEQEEKYKHEYWLPQEDVDKLNVAFAKKAERESKAIIAKMGITSVGFRQNTLKGFWTALIWEKFLEFMKGQTIMLKNGEPFFYQVDVQNFCSQSGAEYPPLLIQETM